MRNPLKIRLPGSWDFDINPITVDVSAIHKELLFSVVTHNPDRKWALMPPSRAAFSERQPEFASLEGSDLRRGLLQAYYGRFLALEPFARRYFTVDEINSSDTSSSLMGNWLEANPCTSDNWLK
jgi:hypothetical protein